MERTKGDRFQATHELTGRYVELPILTLADNEQLQLLAARHNISMNPNARLPTLYHWLAERRTSSLDLQT